MAPRDEAFQDLLRQLKTDSGWWTEGRTHKRTHIINTYRGPLWYVEIPKDSNIRNEEHKKIETPKPKDWPQQIPGSFSAEHCRPGNIEDTVQTPQTPSPLVEDPGFRNTHTHTHPLEHCPHSILVGHKSLVCIKLFCEAVFTLPEEIHVKLEDVTMWQRNWFGICEFDYCDTENEISVVWCDLPTDLPDLILYVFVIMLCFF